MALGLCQVAQDGQVFELWHDLWHSYEHLKENYILHCSSMHRSHRVQ